MGSWNSQPNMMVIEKTPNSGSTPFETELDYDVSIVGRTRADLDLGPEAAAIAKRLAMRFVDLEQIVAYKEGSEPDLVFEASSAVIVRPDRIIFGAVAEDTTLDDLVITLGKKLALRSL